MRRLLVNGKYFNVPKRLRRDWYHCAWRFDFAGLGQTFVDDNGNPETSFAEAMEMYHKIKKEDSAFLKSICPVKFRFEVIDHRLVCKAIVKIGSNNDKNYKEIMVSHTGIARPEQVTNKLIWFDTAEADHYIGKVGQTEALSLWSLELRKFLKDVTVKELESCGYVTPPQQSFNF